MINIIKNKKLVLIILIFILLLILLSTYIKTTEIDAIFDSKNIKKEDELLFEVDKKIENKKTEQKHELTENKNNQTTNSKKNKEIEKLVLIKEIKDPFKAKLKHKNIANSDKRKSPGLDEQKINSDKNLIFLEKNIIAENIINKDQSSKKMIQDKIEVNKKPLVLNPNSIIEENENPENKMILNNIRLPFKLLGIIKNEDNSSALFLYRGQTLLKSEKEKIDIFKIKKINNKNLIISYKEQERRLHLWEEKNNEN